MPTNYIISIIIHYFFILLFCIILTFLVALIKVQLKPKYKITNWYKTIGYSIFYLLFYIVFFIFLKFTRKPIDILFLWNQVMLFKTFFFNLPLITQVLYFCGFCCVISFWILIFYKLHLICKKELITINFFIFSKNPTKIWELFNNFKLNFSVKGISYHLSMLLHDITYKFYKLYPTEKLHKPISKILEFPAFILPKLHYIILIFCLSYDLYYSFYLYITTKFLLIFFIYLLWVNFSNFIEYQNPSINKILVEQYYNTPDIIYINLSENDNYVLTNYSKTLYYPKELLTGEEDMLLNPLIKGYRYVFLKGEVLGDGECDTYYNDFLNFGFNASDLIQKDGQYFIDESKLYTMYFITQE